MAHSLSQANRFLALVSRPLSFPLHRRGYAVASDASSVRGGLERVVVNRSGMVGKVVEETRNGSEASSAAAWAPDPVTGYYRPINHMNEVDPVELRHMLLNHNKVRSSSPSN